MQPGTKRYIMNLRPEDQERLDRIKEATGMCKSVNIRDAIRIMDELIQMRSDLKDDVRGD